VIPGNGFEISAKDKRLAKQITLEAISTSISSLLLFNLFTTAMAVEKPKFIIIEEPEYTLAPIQ